tara:strand:- start:624 stop:860 length:237 start_codon:yes stop_codon:yes gene_type:complete
MSERYKKNIDKLKELENTHPNLSKYWIEYLKKKEEKYIEANKSCENFLDNIINYPDFSNKMIYSLMIIKQLGLLNNNY